MKSAAPIKEIEWAKKYRTCPECKHIGSLFIVEEEWLIKLWVDDVRPAPEGYIWIKTVNEAKLIIICVNRMFDIACPKNLPTIELIDIDYDAGDYASYGGDYIRLLDWLEENNYNYPIHIHSMNPVGVENIRRIIQRNGWKEILD